ncbi:MAG TPA: YicC/YloC family endoribonuclease [Terracidiphilus sp.]|nr:YicC/YloC family endoribonuclease [Terracidiphilus sp.]
MPLYSMTGFARLQARTSDELGYTLSLKSVNHRFLDLQFRMPNGLDGLEMELRRLLKESLVRGHVELSISIDRSTMQKNGYNRELVESYLVAFNEARDMHGLKGEPDLNAALRLPGAMQSENRGDDDLTALAGSVLEQIGPLLEQLKAMRAREGEGLAIALNATLDRLTEATAGVAELRSEIEERYKERLAQRLANAVGPDFNQQRVLEEVAVLVERSDVSEELERMATHIGHFREILNNGGEAGKKLDFLLQEMNREANTLLSKSSGVSGKGTRVTELGLAMKAEIEKAREQIQNIE